jgi:hypothetical protein
LNTTNISDKNLKEIHIKDIKENNNSVDEIMSILKLMNKFNTKIKIRPNSKFSQIYEKNKPEIVNILKDLGEKINRDFNNDNVYHDFSVDELLLIFKLIHIFESDINIPCNSNFSKKCDEINELIKKLGNNINSDNLSNISEFVGLDSGNQKRNGGKKSKKYSKKSKKYSKKSKKYSKKSKKYSKKSGRKTRKR